MLRLLPYMDLNGELAWLQSPLHPGLGFPSLRNPLKLPLQEALHNFIEDCV